MGEGETETKGEADNEWMKGKKLLLIRQTAISNSLNTPPKSNKLGDVFKKYFFVYEEISNKVGKNKKCK